MGEERERARESERESISECKRLMWWVGVLWWQITASTPRARELSKALAVNNVLLSLHT